MVKINPIWPEEGGGNLTPPLPFFAITQKVFELGSSNFLAFPTNWAFIPTD